MKNKLNRTLRCSLVKLTQIFAWEAIKAMTRLSALRERVCVYIKLYFYFWNITYSINSQNRFVWNMVLKLYLIFRPKKKNLFFRLRESVTEWMNCTSTAKVGPLRPRSSLKRSYRDKKGDSFPYVSFPWPPGFSSFVIRKIKNGSYPSAFPHLFSLVVSP